MSVCQNITQLKQQLCIDPGERDLTNIFKPDTEIIGNNRL